MIEDDVDGFLVGVRFTIVQGSDLLCVIVCDNFLSEGSLNRKDLCEGLNQLFVVRLHCIDDQLIIASRNNKNYGMKWEDERSNIYNIVIF